jgi:hypothetical protein
MKTLLCFFALLAFARVADANVPSSFAVQGVLRDKSGQLQSMAQTVTVTLYDAQQGGNVLGMPHVFTDVPVTNGLFTVTVTDPALPMQIGSPSQVWLEVSAGNDTFARQPVTPQLFALRAQVAENVLSVPTGAVMFFNLPACPSGWSDLAAAQGRYLVGMPPGGTLAATVGTALSDKENRPVGIHTHGVTGSAATGIAGTNSGNANISTSDGGGHWHGPAGFGKVFMVDHFPVTCTGYSGTGGVQNTPLCGESTTAPAHVSISAVDNGHSHSISDPGHSHTIPAGGTVAGTPAPYLELRVCQKD